MRISKKRVSNTDDVCRELWEQFRKCVTYHDALLINDNTERAYRFYEGDQWHGIDDETLPMYNFIKPTVDYKVAMTAMNTMTIDYSTPGVAAERTESVLRALNLFALRNWERLKMDSKCWEVIRAAAIAGDAYIYFYDGELHSQLINNTDIFFADEQQKDIQKQPYIFISERRPVDDVKSDARENGIPEDKVSDIIPDNDLDGEITTEEKKDEVKSRDGKCTCLLYLKLEKNGDLRYTRLTKNVVYQPEREIKGYKVYPIASLVINPKKGSSRGRGEVLPLISNQIEVNRNLARRILNAKLTAYSKLVYSGEKVVNPKSLMEVGTAIEVNGADVSDVSKYINYIHPAQMSSEAVNLTNEMIGTTRELAGAGDAALGNIDPTQASGTAIIAVRDQAAIPLNAHMAAFRQFVEDVARIWFETARVYNPSGIDDGSGSRISLAGLNENEMLVRIDVSSTTPFSKFSREQAIERLFSMGQLTFEEYVDSLDDDSAVPKAKLEKILAARAQAMAQQQQLEAQQRLAGLPGTMNDLDALAMQANAEYGGGSPGELDALVNMANTEYGGENGGY